MKLPRALCVIVLAVLACSQLFALDEPVMLQAILLKENSHGKIGAMGERGDYQMLPCNVEKYGGYGMVNALAMLRDIEAELKSKKVDITSFNVALCWNAGVTGATTGNAPPRAYRYALAVQMNYYTITHK